MEGVMEGVRGTGGLLLDFNNYVKNKICDDNDFDKKFNADL